MTTRKEIKKWLETGKKDGKKYMSVYTDAYDYTDFPVYADSIEEFWKKYNDPYHQPNHMCRLMEVYDLSMDVEPQLNERRAFHLPPKPEKGEISE